MIKKLVRILFILITSSNYPAITANAQTPMDGIMMNKNQLCSGLTYVNSSWTSYWEGTFKRTNENIGTLNTQSLMLMVNYGLKDNLNIMINVPYISTHASKGTLHGMKGLQDGSLDIKWNVLKLKAKRNKISIITDIGFSTPLSNYVIDFLPMSIGMGSTNLSGRIIGDFQHGILYSTINLSYSVRSNVKLDRTSYYTTSLHNTNEVEMPNTTSFAFSTGIRSNNLIIDANISRMQTLGGFDIRKNDMPFVSNTMNATMIGLGGKYFLPFDNHIELTAAVETTINGRNVGKATSFEGGLFYVFTFKHKKH